MRRLLLVLAVAGLGACATPAWQSAPHDVRFQSAPPPILHERPRTTNPTDWWYTIEQTTVRPLGENLSPIHWIDRATGGPLAHDINAFGEVLDSPWFTNRIGKGGMSVAAVARGPNTLDGPAEGPLLVLDGKLSGASPGLLVKDVEGNVFLAKFDPPAYPGLASSAEVIATKILYAAGYNVPENYVVRFAADRLVLAEGALGPGRHGEPIPLTEEGLQDLIMHANPTLGGEVQALFSRIVEGVPVGPFDYEGVRRDDPNDTIPHERRRSLRGYRWFCAWTNNTDTRASNTLDVFRAVEGNLGFLVHYLIDFGDALGSLGTQPKYQSDGYEPIISWGVLGELFFSLGLRYRYWLPAKRSPYRAVGMFEAEVFEPELWSPSIPNPAFEASNALDDYWAAALIARFDRTMIEAIVAEAQYRDPGAARYVIDTLGRRKEKILRRAFSRVAPLDDAEVVGAEARFVDLGVATGLERPTEVAYRFVLRASGAPGVLDAGAEDVPRFDLGAALSGPLDRQNPFFTLEVERRVGERRFPPVKLHLRRILGELFPVALERGVR